MTTTLGFLHSSMEVGEKVVRELAKRTRELTVVSEAFQKHLLDGIRWALRIDPRAVKP